MGREESRTYIQQYGYDHQSRVEPYQRLVFHEAILLHESLLHNPEEIVVQTGVDEADEDFRGAVPHAVDIDVSVSSSSQPKEEENLPRGKGGGAWDTRGLTYVWLTGGSRWAGIKMQNTATLIAVMTKAVPYLSF